MDTAIDTFEEISLAYDDQLICDTGDCENAGEWLRKHGACTRVNCHDCKAGVQWQLNHAEPDEDFWCPVCNTSADLGYWLDNMKWILI